MAKSLLNPDNIAQTLSLQRVKRSPNFEEFNNEYLGINVKLEHLNTNTSTGHIADITVNDLAKLHLPCIHGKVLKLNVEFNQDENHLNIKVKYLFPEGNNLTGGFKLEHSKIMDSSRTNLKYLDSFFEFDVQLSGKMFKGSITDMFNQMYYFSGNIEPGVVFSLSMENSISVNLLDISLNFQSLETKFKVDQSVYTLVLPYSSYLSSLSSLELKLEDHDDSIEASISYGTCICELEYIKNSTNIMRISVYESMNILLDLRLKMILKEDDFENELEVFYQFGGQYKSHGKIIVKFSFSTQRYYDPIDNVIVMVDANRGFIKIMMLPGHLNWKEYCKFEMYFDAEERSHELFSYNNSITLRIKGSVLGAELFSLQTRNINTQDEVLLDTMASLNSSVTYVPRYFKEFSRGNFTAKIRNNSAFVYISKNRSPVLNLDLSKHENLYRFKLSNIEIPDRKPVLLPYFIWYEIKDVVGYEKDSRISELSFEMDNSGVSSRVSGVLLSSDGIRKLDFTIRRNLEKSKLTFSRNNKVYLLAELKEEDMIRSIFVAKTYGKHHIFNYNATENGDPISLLRFINNILSFKENDYSLNIWQFIDSGTRHYQVFLNMRQNLEFKLVHAFEYISSDYLFNRQVYELKIDPSSGRFKILNENSLTGKHHYKGNVYDLDFGMTTEHLFKLCLEGIIDLEVEIGGLNYISMKSKLLEKYDLSTKIVGEVAYMNLNGKDLFSYKVDTGKTDNYEIEIDVPISLIINPFSWKRKYKSEQPMLTTVVYSNNATLFGIYIKVKDFCYNDYSTPSLELSRYHEIGFNNETMRLGAWEGPNFVYRCLACDEYIWKLVEIGGDTFGHQVEEIYDKDNMDSGSGDFGSGDFGSGYYG